MNKTFFVSSLVCAASLGLYAANMDSEIERAFKDGVTTGHIGIYGQVKSFKGGAQNSNTLGKSKKMSGYLAPSASIDYKTAPVSFVSLGMAAWANAPVWENIEGDYDGAHGNKEGKIYSDSIVHQIYARIGDPNRDFSVVVGRQEVDLEWMTDYVQGVVANAGHSGLSATALWANRQASVGFDSVSSKFDRMNGSDGVYALDLKASHGESTVNVYYYYARDLVQIPGIKVSLELGGDNVSSKTTLHYAHGIVKLAENGYFANVEEVISFSRMGLDAGFGYIQTDKNGGAGSVSSFGDQTRLEEGNHLFDTNAKTFYGFVEYTLGNFNAAALYGNTTYGLDSGGNEQELDLMVGFNFLKNLEAQVVYANISNKTKSEGYDVYKALLSYKF